MKNITPWSNNQSKNQTSWTGSSKPSTAWGSNITKVPTIFIAIGKSATAWGVNFMNRQTWWYDNQVYLYDDPALQFDYIINNNTDNQRGVTIWNAS